MTLMADPLYRRLGCPEFCYVPAYRRRLDCTPCRFRYMAIDRHRAKLSRNRPSCGRRSPLVVADGPVAATGRASARKQSMLGHSFLSTPGEARTTTPFPAPAQGYWPSRGPGPATRRRRVGVVRRGGGAGGHGAPRLGDTIGPAPRSALLRQSPSADPLAPWLEWGDASR